jgi:primase-polymerase (primpol)-like protein
MIGNKSVNCKPPGRTKKEIEEDAAKPPACPTDLDAIPQLLKDLPNFVWWSWEWRESKWTKVPYQTNGKKAKADVPETCAMHEDLLATDSKMVERFDGPGFEFAEGDGITGIDLDNCLDPHTGELKPWALWWVERFYSYTEISPTHTGLKIIIKGKKPGTSCKKKYHDGEIEIYDRGRFFTLTASDGMERRTTLKIARANLKSYTKSCSANPAESSRNSPASTATRIKSREITSAPMTNSSPRLSPPRMPRSLNR